MKDESLFTPKSLKAFIDVSFESDIRQEIINNLKRTNKKSSGEKAIITEIKEKAARYTDTYALKKYTYNCILDTNEHELRAIEGSSTKRRYNDKQRHYNKNRWKKLFGLKEWYKERSSALP